MENNSSYNNLNFSHRPRNISSKVITTIIILVVFTLMMLFIPKLFLWLILLFPLAFLSWSATYGFGGTLSDLTRLFRKLENL